jgi:predicted GNAT family acetyltransferase
MEVRTYATAAEFLSHAGKYLAKDEARYGLIFGVSKRLLKTPHVYGQDDPWFCAVSDETVICAAAMRTPPHKVVLAHFNGDATAAAESLADAVFKIETVLPGVLGDKDLTVRFMETWRRRHGVTVREDLTVNQRIYKLEKVNGVPISLGRMRPAMEADSELVKKWTRAFHVGASGAARNMPETNVAPLIDEGAVFFWEDGEPVSMAMKYRPTDRSMDVSTVYTPPELRGRGYATSLVAELSRNILQSGCEFCTLYTNLANPVSNAIYMKIGYKPVADCVNYTFEMP